MANAAPVNFLPDFPINSPALFTVKFLGFVTVLAAAVAVDAVAVDAVTPAALAAVAVPRTALNAILNGFVKARSARLIAFPGMNRVNKLPTVIAKSSSEPRTSSLSKSPFNKLSKLVTVLPNAVLIHVNMPDKLGNPNSKIPKSFAIPYTVSPNPVRAFLFSSVSSAPIAAPSTPNLLPKIKPIPPKVIELPIESESSALPV